MSLLKWSRRVLIACVVVWASLILVYVTLGFARVGVLPQPFNLMIMLILSTATLATGAACFTARLEARLGRIEGAYITTADRWDERDDRLNAHLLRIYRRLDELETPTLQLYRPRSHLAVVGTAAVANGPRPVDPEVIDLSRRLHRKMLEGDPA